MNVIVLAVSRILLRRHRRTFHLLRQREAHSLEDPSRGYTYSVDLLFFLSRQGNFNSALPRERFADFHPAPFTRGAAAPACVFGAPRFGDTPRSSSDASMDTASPVASRGHSTTLATDSVGARCHWLSEHAAHPSPMHAQSVMHRHSLQLQLPDGTTVVPLATARAARRFLSRA